MKSKVNMDFVINRVLNSIMGKSVNVKEVSHTSESAKFYDLREFKSIHGYSDKTGKHYNIIPVEHIFIKNRDVQFQRPNQIALYLSVWKKNYTNLKKKKKEIEIKMNGISNAIPRIYNSKIYDYIEYFNNCIIYSCLALEAFANHSIFVGYVFQGETSSAEKEKIELGWKIDKKIKKILPEIYNVDPPNNEKTKAIIELFNYRNIIVHNKNTNYDKIYEILFDNDFVFKSLILPIEIIKYFAESNLNIPNAIIPFGFKNNGIYIMPWSEKFTEVLQRKDG